MPRKTEQRSAIRQVLEESERPLNPQEILKLAQAKVSTLGLATVYRTVRRGLDQGWLHAVDVPGDSPRYEPATGEHHHHFHCRACGRVFEVSECRLQNNPTLPPGFSVEGHEVVLFGRCDQCPPAKEGS